MQQPLLPLASDSHLVVVPSRIVAYHHMLRRGIEVNQVLVEWLGLPQEERSWEDLDYIQGLVPVMNLEDKLRSEVGGDVTVALDGTNSITRLTQDLDEIQNTTDDDIIGDIGTTQSNGLGPSTIRPTQAHKST